MRNLPRTLALTAVLVLTGLAIPGPAATSSWGDCFVHCFGGGTFYSYTIGATQSDCCSGNILNYCPAGSDPVPRSWNRFRC
jgi:hypothetical protein